MPFSPNYLTNIGKRQKQVESDFTLTDKKLLRRARNTLKRVEIIPKIGILGEHARYLAEGLDRLLKGSNEKVFMV